MKITLPFPSRRRAPAEDEPDTPRRSRWPILLAALALASLGLAAAVWRPWEQPGGAAQAPAVPVTKDDLVITVEGSGALQPGRSVELPAQVAGEVREVLVKPGQAVRAGQVLAQLDDRALQIALREAEAARQSAQIKLSQAQRGDATPQELAGAQASLREAEAALAETRGSLASDLRQAEADLRAAQARLDALRNPTPDRLSTAQRTLTEAQAGLEQTRNDRSAAKTRAGGQCPDAGPVALRDRQAAVGLRAGHRQRPGPADQRRREWQAGR
jgi:multidrug efflux pump subunit AcrA (membrane-fusion protein)